MKKNNVLKLESLRWKDTFARHRLSEDLYILLEQNDKALLQRGKGNDVTHTSQYKRF